MPRFAANLSMMFTERALLERPAAARAAGFQAVEVQFPYEAPAEDWEAALRGTGLPMVLINVPAGDTTRHPPGIAALPERRDEYRAGVETALRYAERLSVKRVNVLAGVVPRTLSIEAARDCFVENVAWTADRFRDLGVTVLIEAINIRDVPGFLLNGSNQALAVIFQAGRDNLAFQYDCYHMQIMEGDIIPTLERIVEHVGHIQFADTPGRHEPGTGELNYANIFAAIDRLDYAGWTSAEYRPSGRTEDTLGWMTAAGRA